MLHWKTFAPTPIPLTDVVPVFGDAIVPLPLARVHVPVAGGVTVFPVSVAFGAVLHAC